MSTLNESPLYKNEGIYTVHIKQFKIICLKWNPSALFHGIFTVLAKIFIQNLVRVDFDSDIGIYLLYIYFSILPDYILLQTVIKSWWKNVEFRQIEKENSLQI